MKHVANGMPRSGRTCTSHHWPPPAPAGRSPAPRQAAEVRGAPSGAGRTVNCPCNTAAGRSVPARRTRSGRSCASSGSASSRQASSSGGATATPSGARHSSPARRPGTTRSCSGTWREAVETIRAAIAAGKRICVHGDYDVDGICATALALSCLRALGAERGLAPAESVRRGLRPVGADARPPRRRGLRARPDGRLRDHRGRRGRAREGARARVVVTDHHRPGDQLPDCPIVARGRPSIRSPSCAAPVSSASSPRRSASRIAAAPGPRRARDDRRRRSARRREPRASRSQACARSRGRRSRGCAR